MAQEIMHLHVSSLPQTPPSLSRKSADNQSSLTQSTDLRRIVRKTGDTSISKRSQRSYSKKSSEKSCQSLIVSKFYTKMVSSQITNDSLANSIRSDVLTRREDEKIRRKREPTPDPAYILRKKSKEEPTKKDFEIESDLLIAELQKKLSEQKEKTKLYEKRAQASERQVKKKTSKVIELQRRLMVQLQKQNMLLIKLKSFQEQATKNQSRLVQTKSALQKLKKNILQTRYAQMQVQNASLRAENQIQKSINQELSEQLKRLQLKCYSLESEISALKSAKSNQLVKARQVIQQVSQLVLKNEYTVKLQNTIAKLEIKLNYLNRKKNEELQKLKQKKNKELAKVRLKLTHINQELSVFKKQNEKLKRNPTLTERMTLMNSTQWSTHDETFCLSLSP